ncbi:MAG TPA: SGNH/GDSL hydrolase family protein [Lysobacter sp.]
MNPMRTPGVLLTAVLLLCGTSCGVAARPARPERVLFVGNSLTYVGNLPAVFASLAASNGREVQADMIVKGGATLAQRAADGSVARALREGRYPVLVLQERGGDLTCAFGPESCTASREAIAQLARLAKSRNARVFLLGTYQSDPRASRRLVMAESGAASEAGVAYVEVSETLQRLKTRTFGLRWFAPDGLHPGPLVTLLDAVQLYRGVFGGLPAPGALTVRAPIYGSTSGLTEALRGSASAPPRPDTPRGTHYPLPVVGKLVAAVSGAAADHASGQASPRGAVQL